MPGTFTRRLIACAWLLCAARVATGGEVLESVLTAQLPERSIAALVTHLAEHKPFTRAILLLPGAPGIMKIQSAGQYAMKGNFLIRSRQHWLDDETLVLSVDAPSDEWRGFIGRFRATPRYAEDIRGLAAALDRAYGPLPLVIAGTSEGSVSAYYVALALAPRPLRVILTSSMFNNSDNSQGVAALDFADFKPPLLWVHHEADACRWSPYWQAKRHAEKTGAPLITVRGGGGGNGIECQPFSAHGYVGIEAATVAAMKAWALGGAAVDVGQ